MYPSLIWNPYKFYSLKTLSRKGDTLNYNNSEMNFNPLSPNIHQQILQTDLYTFH